MTWGTVWDGLWYIKTSVGMQKTGQRGYTEFKGLQGS